MITNTHRLILVTNGRRETRPALDEGIWLAGALHLEIHLLGLCEADDRDHPVRDLVEEMTPALQACGVPFQVEIKTGQAEHLVNQSAEPPGSMVVLGPLGRPPLRRFLLGRSFRQFMEDLLDPILYVSEARLPIRRLLVCMGGLEYSLHVFRQALTIARPLQAEITFLHVVEPVSLQYPLSHEVETHWQDLLTTETPHGRTLRQVIGETEQAGLSATVHLRHGQIVTEILAEIEKEGYDLVCMGSMFSAQGLRHLALPNITAEIAESTHCPILTVRVPEDETVRSGTPTHGQPV